MIDTKKELEFNEKHESYKTFLRYLDNKYNKGRFSIDKLLSEEYLVIDTRQSDLRLYRGVVPTLRTGRHGILYVRDGKFRRLSGYESLLLQVWPKEIAEKINGKIDEITLLSQAGNAMTVPVVEAFGKTLLNFIFWFLRDKGAVRMLGDGKDCRNYGIRDIEKYRELNKLHSSLSSLKLAQEKQRLSEQMSWEDKGLDKLID